MSAGTARPARRTTAGIALAATGVLLTTACGGVGAGGGGGSSSGPATVSTFGFGLQDEIASVRVSVAQKKAGVTAKVTEGGFDQQQFLSAVASGSPPDLVYLDRNDIGQYAASGVIQPLDDCISAGKVDVSQYRKPALDGVTVRGKVYGFPEFYSVRVVIADDQALNTLSGKGLGLADVTSSDPATIEAVNAALTQRSGARLQRIGYDSKIPDFLPLWAAAWGTTLVSADGTKAQLDSPQVVRAVTMAKSLVGTNGGWSAYQAYRDSWDFFGAQNQYVKHQLGAMPMEDWYVNSLASASPDVKVTVAPFTAATGRPITLATGSAWAVPKGAKNKAAACRFAAALTDSATWVEAAKARAKALRDKGKVYTGTYTGNARADAVITSQVFTPTGRPALDAAVKTIQSVQSVAVAQPASLAGRQVTDALESAVTKVMEGSASPQQALAAAQATAQKALDDGAASLDRQSS